MEDLNLDDVDLFVVKGIKYRAMPGNYFGKTNYVIESEGWCLLEKLDCYVKQFGK